MDSIGLVYTYEPDKFTYIVPASKHKYTPDWKIGPNVYIETKGKFTKEDRDKLLLVREQNPDIQVLLLFQRAKNKVHKNSPTSYGDWCDKNGFIWADFSAGGIPKDWIKYGN